MSTRKLHRSAPVDLAAEVVLERRHRSYSCGEPRPLMMGTSRAPGDLKPPAIAKRATSVAADVEQKLAIRATIEAFEMMPAKDVRKSLGVVTTDPYISVANGQSLVVDDSVLEDWIKGSVFKTLSAEFPDKPEFVDMNIVLIDEATAAATYTIVQGGVIGSSAVILTKAKQKKWRISIHSQHPISGTP